MADITMCNNEKCKDRLRCHRYTATPNEYAQAYFLINEYFEPKDNNECHHFWNNKDYPRERKLYEKKKN